MSELAYSSAVAIAEKIRLRDISSREAVDYFLARVEALDKRINSVVTIDAERARAEAGAADAALARGEVRGPLHGVPMTVKDSFQTAGMRTTSGAPELAEFIPQEDAWPVARLRAAGAIIFGKTNLPIYAGDLQSHNEVFGTTNNPYDLSRTPGGSSGGSAAALACGFTPLELGSDIGGSIRLPSHMSGVAGHKPSYGIVPAHGQIPGPPGTLTLADLAVSGPMARTVEDLKLGLDLMAGPNRWDHPAWRLRLPPPRRRTLKQYRVAAWLDDPACRVEPESRDLLENAAQTLASAGALVDRDARPAFTLSKVADTFFALLQAALAGGVSLDRIEAYAAAAGKTPTANTRRLVAMRHRQWLSYNERRLQMRKRWEEFFTDWDAVLLPVMPCAAIPHDHSEPQASRTALVGGEQQPYWNLITWMAPAGACYLPATVVPAGCLGNGTPGRNSDCGAVPGGSHDARSGQALARDPRRLSTTAWLLNQECGPCRNGRILAAVGGRRIISDMGRLVLVRHGESEGNVNRIFTTSPMTLALTELGRKQARAAATVIAAISNPRIVIASPYIRARDTAAIIAEELSLPLEIREGLHERETGEFAGKPYESILEAEGYDHSRPWTWVPPGGESYEHVRDRVGPILDQLVACFSNEDVVVVSHGGVMVSMWAYITGCWDDAPVPANCAIVLVEHRQGQFLKPQLIGNQHSQRDAGG